MGPAQTPIFTGGLDGGGGFDRTWTETRGAGAMCSPSAAVCVGLMGVFVIIVQRR